MNWQNQKVLVTGGAGLLGSHLVEKLVHIGASVTVVDNLSTGKFENLNSVRDKIHVIYEDISCSRNLDVEDAVVFHLAAFMQVWKSVQNPYQNFQTNVIGSQNIIDECRIRQCKRFVFASSCGVYGNWYGTPLREFDAFPTHPYGASKLMSEILGMAYYECYNLPFVAIRLFSLYGPRLRQTVLYDILDRAHKEPGNTVTVRGTGNVIRDFTRVGSAVEALILAAESKEVGVFNFSGGNPLSIMSAARIMLDAAGIHKELVPNNEKLDGEMEALISDNDKFLRNIGYVPHVQFKEGIGSFIESYRRDHA